MKSLYEQRWATWEPGSAELSKSLLWIVFLSLPDCFGQLSYLVSLWCQNHSAKNVNYAFNSRTWGGWREQQTSFEFKVNLISIESSTSARAAQWNPVSNNKKAQDVVEMFPMAMVLNLPNISSLPQSLLSIPKTQTQRMVPPMVGYVFLPNQIIDNPRQAHP